MPDIFSEQTLASIWDAIYAGARLALGDHLSPEDERLLPFLIVLVPLIGLYLPVMVVIGSMRAKRSSSKTDRKEKVAAYQSTTTIERLLQWLAPPRNAWVVGNIIVSFEHLVHYIVFGTTGSGKSTFMRMRILRPYLGLPGMVRYTTRHVGRFVGHVFPHMHNAWVDGHWPAYREKRGGLFFTGNKSKPPRAAICELLENGYPAYVWTPDPMPGQGFGLDVLEGPPENVAQRLIAMQPVGQGNTGLRSGAVEGMLVDTTYTLDRQGLARTFENILKIIRTVGVRDLDEHGQPCGEARELTRQEQSGLEDWCTRLSTLRRRLGASVGQDLRISEALKRGEVILVEGSSYANPNSTEQLASLFTYLAMWLVTVVGHFDLIIDEPGAVDPDMFTRLLTATRTADVSIGISPQSLKQISQQLREMCTTALLLGSAAASHEAQELESKMVHGAIEPVDFVLLQPKRWIEKLLIWLPRRGLRSCSGYLLNNGRLDLVKTKPLTKQFLDAILGRWPNGSIPQLRAGSMQNQASPASPTGQVSTSPESASAASAQSASENDPDAASALLSTLHDAEDVAVSESASSASVSAICPEAAMQSVDGRRLWGKGKAEPCRTLDACSASIPDWVRAGLKKPHRLWPTTETNGQGGPGKSPRPKTQAKRLYGEEAGQRTTVTVYVWWYELVSGKPVPADKPTIDHLCHTYDDACPGPNPCEIPGCDDPAHPEGFPCQHTLCYEIAHLEAVAQKGTDGNARRQAEQKKRHAEWLKKIGPKLVALKPAA